MLPLKHGQAEAVWEITSKNFISLILHLRSDGKAHTWTHRCILVEEGGEGEIGEKDERRGKVSHRNWDIPQDCESTSVHAHAQNALTAAWSTEDAMASACWCKEWARLCLRKRARRARACAGASFHLPSPPPPSRGVIKREIAHAHVRACIYVLLVLLLASHLCYQWCWCLWDCCQLIIFFAPANYIVVAGPSLNSHL